MDSEFYKNALDWLKSGISLIPIPKDGSKHPGSEWKQYQFKRVSESKLRGWLMSGNGLGIVGGAISGNLIVLDFDEQGLQWEFLKLIEEQFPTITNDLPIVSTPGGGAHIYLRTDGDCPKSMKLAMSREIRDDGKQTRIEIKAEAGLVLAPGCPPECHKLNKTYELLTGDLTNIPILSADTVEALFAIAKSFDEKPPEPEDIVKEPNSFNSNGRKRPGDEYNQSGDIRRLLELKGYTRCGSRGETEFWKRPGKEERGHSATFNHGGHGFFYNFSSNDPYFQVGKAHKPFAVLTYLEYGGDFSAAARALDKQGYGDPMPKIKVNHERILKAIEAEDDTDTYHRTDLGNANRLVRDFGNEICYCKEIGRWFVWDSTRWEMDTTGAIDRLAVKTTLNIYSEAKDAMDKEERVAICKWATQSESKQKLQSMIDLAKIHIKTSIKQEQLDQYPWLTCVQNGMIDLRNGAHLDSDPGAYCTRQINSDYDPEATSPRWEAFLEQVLPDANVREFVQRAIGYTLTGEISEQCLFFLYGEGRNGKSTFLETLTHLLGDYARTTRAETIMLKRGDAGIANDVAALRGARMVSASEVNEGQRLNEALIKTMTGGDTIDARFLYAESFNFKPVFKLFMRGNHKPKISGNDAGIWRRMRLIPFIVNIPDEEQDKQLGNKLLEELPGILNWAVRGCLDWQTNGLAAPSAVKEATQEYRDEQDILGAFFVENCQFDQYARCDKTELWHLYKEWANKNEEKAFDSVRKFNTCVKSHEGVREDMSHGRRIWKGLQIRNSETLFADVESPGKNELGSIDDKRVTQMPETHNFIADSTTRSEDMKNESPQSPQSPDEKSEIFEIEITGIGE